MRLGGPCRHLMRTTRTLRRRSRSQHYLRRLKKQEDANEMDEDIVEGDQDDEDEDDELLEDERFDHMEEQKRDEIIDDENPNCYGWIGGVRGETSSTVGAGPSFAEDTIGCWDVEAERVVTVRQFNMNEQFFSSCACPMARLELAHRNHLSWS